MCFYACKRRVILTEFQEDSMIYLIQSISYTDCRGNAQEIQTNCRQLYISKLPTFDR